MPTKNFSENDFILYPNYFGICDDNVKILSSKYSKLIVDNAHSFYSEPCGFACFNSVRKFLNVYNGSYLWINDMKYIPEKENPKTVSSQALIDSEKNEIEFDKKEIMQISDDVAEAIKNCKFDLEKRKEKFIFFYYKYQNVNLLDININSAYSPFVYPLLLQSEEAANSFVEGLKNEGKIIYRYWDKLPTNFPEYKFYSRLVSIPLI